MARHFAGSHNGASTCVEPSCYGITGLEIALLKRAAGELTSFEKEDDMFAQLVNDRRAMYIP
jgi:hypothetical protein